MPGMPHHKKSQKCHVEAYRPMNEFGMSYFNNNSYFIQAYIREKTP